MNFYLHKCLATVVSVQRPTLEASSLHGARWFGGGKVQTSAGRHLNSISKQKRPLYMLRGVVLWKNNHFHCLLRMGGENLVDQMADFHNWVTLSVYAPAQESLHMYNPQRCHELQWGPDNHGGYDLSADRWGLENIVPKLALGRKVWESVGMWREGFVVPALWF